MILFSPSGRVDLTGGASDGSIHRMWPDPASYASTVWRGVCGVLAPALTVTLSQVVNSVEPVLKVIALFFGGVCVPVYTLWSMRKSNTLRDAQLKRMKEQRGPEQVDGMM